jgi:C1A family cysteine protease
MLPMPDESSSIGGHAMLLVGYDNDRQVYIVRNSWGTGWGDAGYAYMPFSYIDAAGANDFCVGTIYR